jgi:hypothetical protein
MAYVAISSALIENTMNNIDKMCDKERNQLGEVPNDIRVDPDNHLAIDLAWGKYKHLRGTFDEDMTQSVDYITLNIELADLATSVSFYVRSTHDRFVVPNYRSNGYNSMSRKIGDTHSVALTVAAAFVAHQRQRIAINAKWKAIKEQVKEFLNAAKSLNEALKLWPALALYISDQYINRVNENASRSKTVSKAADILASIKTDEITAAAVSVKLT